MAEPQSRSGGRRGCSGALPSSPDLLTRVTAQLPQGGARRPPELFPALLAEPHLVRDPTFLECVPEPRLSQSKPPIPSRQEP